MMSCKRAMVAGAEAGIEAGSAATAAAGEAEVGGTVDTAWLRARSWAARSQDRPTTAAIPLTVEAMTLITAGGVGPFFGEATTPLFSPPTGKGGIFPPPSPRGPLLGGGIGR